MKRTAIALWTCLLLALPAVGQTIQVTKEIKGRTGEWMHVIPTTDVQNPVINWDYPKFNKTTEVGLLEVPAPLNDPNGKVFKAHKAGTYVIKVNTAKLVGDFTKPETLKAVPSNIATCKITVVDVGPTPPTPPPAGAPVVTAGTAPAVVGVDFSYQVVASNAPTAYAATGLPGGLSIDPTKGVITGRATGEGSYPATVTATNKAGSGTAVVTIVVSKPTTPDTPPPIDGPGLRMMIVYETGNLPLYPSAQRSAMFSQKVRDYLRPKLYKDDNTYPALWTVDKDSPPLRVPDWVKTTLDKYKGQTLPYLIVSNGKTGYTGPVPENTDKLLELLKKYAE